MSRARSLAVWAIRYGIPGVALRAVARRGDLIARSAVDQAAIADPGLLYDGLRALGPVTSNRLISASAHHAVVNQVLRHDAFVADPGGAPTRTLNRLLAAAIDPHALGPVDVPSLLGEHRTAHPVRAVPRSCSERRGRAPRDARAARLPELARHCCSAGISSRLIS